MKSSSAATTEEKLGACDAALYAKVKEAALCGLGVDLYKEARANDQKEIAELRKSSTGLFSNPFVWAAIGVIAGTYIGARATR